MRICCRNDAQSLMNVNLIIPHATHIIIEVLQALWRLLQHRRQVDGPARTLVKESKHLRGVEVCVCRG